MLESQLTDLYVTRTRLTVWRIMLARLANREVASSARRLTLLPSLSAWFSGHAVRNAGVDECKPVPRAWTTPLHPARHDGPSCDLSANAWRCMHTSDQLATGKSEEFNKTANDHAVKAHAGQAGQSVRPVHKGMHLPTIDAFCYNTRPACTDVFDPGCAECNHWKHCGLYALHICLLYRK